MQELKLNQKKLQGARTRDDLLAAAIKVFAERGYHDATIEDIVASTGTTRGALYWHFSNKEDFLASLLTVLLSALFSSTRVAMKRLLRKRKTAEYDALTRLWLEQRGLSTLGFRRNARRRSKKSKPMAANRTGEWRSPQQ
jgi:AcrR family transcriptional regulator